MLTVLRSPRPFLWKRMHTCVCQVSLTSHTKLVINVIHVSKSWVGRGVVVHVPYISLRFHGKNMSCNMKIIPSRYEIWTPWIVESDTREVKCYKSFLWSLWVRMPANVIIIPGMAQKRHFSSHKFGIPAGQSRVSLVMVVWDVAGEVHIQGFLSSWCRTISSHFLLWLGLRLKVFSFFPFFGGVRDICVIFVFALWRRMGDRQEKEFYKYFALISSVQCRCSDNIHVN